MDAHALLSYEHTLSMITKIIPVYSPGKVIACVSHFPNSILYYNPFYQVELYNENATCMGSHVCSVMTGLVKSFSADWTDVITLLGGWSRHP